MIGTTVSFSQNPFVPFGIDSPSGVNLTVARQVATSVRDSVNLVAPDTKECGIYTKVLRVKPTTAGTDDLKAAHKISVGVTIPVTSVKDALSVFKFSGSVISPSQDLLISGHIGVGDATLTDQVINRSFSFGGAGAQSFEHSDSVMFCTDTGQTNVAFWLTLVNYSASKQPYELSLNATLWSSLGGYPVIRDVNAR